MVSLDSWFGNLSRPISIYCERTSPAWNAEPLNAVSNLAFFIAAWGIWRLQCRRPNVALQGPIQALWIIVAIVGAGSLTFHTLATRWAEWADVVPILVFMLVYFWIVMTVFFGFPSWLKILISATFFGLTFYLESDAFEKVLWGGAMYLPALAIMMAAGAAIWHRDGDAGRAFFAAALLFLLSFAARTIDEPLCQYLPVGTHYFWHFFNAGVLYLLVRTLILHAPGGAESAVLARNRLLAGVP
jgi:Ceramidase